MRKIIVGAQPESLGSALADRYRFEREIGSGAMATIHLAEDVKHHRKVAIKVLKPELAAMLGAERFLREIDVTAKLQHPHILPLYDSGHVEGFSTTSRRSSRVGRCATGSIAIPSCRSTMRSAWSGR